MERLFGKYLKALRNDRKLTLRDVEKQVNISNAYLSQVERGERGIPTMKILAKLAEVYGVPVSVLNNKAAEELRNNKVKGGEGRENKEGIPAPDIEFICRGYENLSEGNKQALKKFLQHLEKEDKEKNDNGI